MILVLEISSLITRTENYYNFNPETKALVYQANNLLDWFMGNCVWACIYSSYRTECVLTTALNATLKYLLAL